MLIFHVYVGVATVVEWCIAAYKSCRKALDHWLLRPYVIVCRNSRANISDPQSGNGPHFLSCCNFKTEDISRYKLRHVGAFDPSDPVPEWLAMRLAVLYAFFFDGITFLLFWSKDQHDIGHFLPLRTMTLGEIFHKSVVFEAWPVPNALMERLAFFRLKACWGGSVNGRWSCLMISHTKPRMSGLKVRFTHPELIRHRITSLLWAAK